MKSSCSDNGWQLSNGFKSGQNTQLGRVEGFGLRVARSSSFGELEEEELKSAGLLLDALTAGLGPESQMDFILSPLSLDSQTVFTFPQVKT